MTHPRRVKQEEPHFHEGVALYIRTDRNGDQMWLESRSGRERRVASYRWVLDPMDMRLFDITKQEIIASLRLCGRLLAFKSYVHGRLDEAGISVDPDSPHKAAGCRIGGRLDEVLFCRPAPSLDVISRGEFEKQLSLVEQLHARAGMYSIKSQHDAWVEARNKLIAMFDAAPSPFASVEELAEAIREAFEDDNAASMGEGYVEVPKWEIAAKTALGGRGR